MRSANLESGIDAIAALCHAASEGNPFDFLLLDYRLPAMDGAEVAAAVRATPAIGDIPIIMLTSVAYGRGRNLGDGVGPDACLTKPARESHLLHALTAARAKRLVAAPDPVASTGGQRLISPEFLAHSGRVLVADDNAVNQRVAVRMLERLGLRTDVAANGLEAVRMLRTLPYDAVFMDCQMPEMDGFAATREIRRAERQGEHIPIIAMTAEALSGAREQCLAAGMDDYIAKPVRFEDLSQAVRKWLVEKASEDLTEVGAIWLGE